MSEQQNCNIFADGITVTMKRIFVLVSVVALLVAIVAVQSASADESQTPSHQADTGTGGDAASASASSAGDPEVGSTTADVPEAAVEPPAPEAEPEAPTVLDPETELNEPALQSPATPAGLPREYEDALANWPADEAEDFRQYYLAHPDELEFIEVERLIRPDQPVARNFSVRAANTLDGPVEPLQCGGKVALVMDASSSINSAEMEQIKSAANTVIDNFAGTDTKLGIFNFATNSPTDGKEPLADAELQPTSMLEGSDVAAAKAAISKLKAGYAADHPNATGYSDNGRNTNWKAGLDRVKDGNYDAIIFVTDGPPNAPVTVGDPFGIFQHEAIREAYEVAGEIQANGSEIIGVYVGESNPQPLPVYSQFCHIAPKNSSACRKITNPNARTEILPYIKKTDYLEGLEYENIYLYGRKSYSNQLADKGQLPDSYVPACNGDTWSYQGHEFRSTFDCPIIGRNNTYAATRVKAHPEEVLKHISTQSVRVDSTADLESKLDELTSSCKGTVRIEKSIVDSQGTPTNGPLNGWSFEASKSVVTTGGSENVVTNQTYVTDDEGVTEIRIASGNAGNADSGTATIREIQQTGYTLRPQNGKTAVCTIIGANGQASTTASYDNLDDDPYSFRLSGVSQDDKVTCKVQNTPFVAPEVSLKKRVSTEGSTFTDADAKTEEAALNLGSENARFSLELEVENTGGVPLSYLEFTDRQLEVPESTPITLSGLTCGASDTVTFSGENDTVAKVQLQTPLAPGQKVKCCKDGSDAYRVEELDFQDDGAPTSEDKYFGNEATVTAKANASADESATASDPAWLRAQPALVLFKSFNGGQPRTITGVVGQKFTADYNIILTNDGYVEAQFPSIIDRPKPATGLVAKSVRVYDRELTQSTGNLTKQDKLIVGGSADLTTDDNGESWVLDTSKLLPMKARSKGNFRLEVTYEVEQVLPVAGHGEDEYVCDKVRNSQNRNENRGLFNTIGVDETDGLVPVRGNTRNVCYSVLRANTDVTKKINGQGEQVSDADSAEEQKNKKTITNPDGADAFEVSYVIDNTSKTGPKYANQGTAEFQSSDITSVVLEDYALDGNGLATGQKVPVQGITCTGGDAAASVVTENDGSTTVAFNPGLASGKTATCTGTVKVSELEPDHVYDDVHGDQVKVTPTYALNVNEQAVPGDPTYPEPGKVTGPPVEDKAWVGVELPTNFTVTKDGVSDAVVIKGEAEEAFEATYRVTVRNESSGSGKPSTLIESPSAVDGVTVTAVKAGNSQGSNNKLLSSDELVTFNDEGDGTFTLDPTNFRDIPGIANGNNDTSATIEVHVFYKVTSAEGIPVTPDESTGTTQPDYSALRCEGSDRSRGLFNSVAVEGQDAEAAPTSGNSDDACIDLVIPRIHLEKLIEDADADTKDAAAAIMPGAPKVKITYTVINTGTAEITRFRLNDRLGETANSGSSMEIAGLECDKPVTVDAQGSSGVEVTPVTPLPVWLGDGGAPATGDDASTITCSWSADNPSAMNYDDDGFHVNTASVSATFQKSNIQGSVSDITDSDSAWAIQLKSLDGTLPKSGGIGIAPFGLGALILFAGAVLLSRRQRKV
ncbi:VWA domain-containing protein [Corynebacterium sp. P7003]|uniref:VWA domain-containing protein n=1 Tax=Corynebacterium pygosceleis TaxID=2800406 RepID=A0ABT3WVI2_9CORY|nr:vWA domain-containing protein [Corynebacterium pygosceleis]MCX7445250.1 VWA domain-containing protein [Corynebacterium pygosceleis]